MVVEAPGIEFEQLWHDRSRWASWIDGFSHLEKFEGDWPLEGSRRVYSSRVTGRALVSERVMKYTAGDGLALFVEDERTTATQRVRFETDGTRTRITVEVEGEDAARPALVVAAQTRGVAAAHAPALLL